MRREGCGLVEGQDYSSPGDCLAATFSKLEIKASASALFCAPGRRTTGTSNLSAAMLRKVVSCGERVRWLGKTQKPCGLRRVWGACCGEESGRDKRLQRNAPHPNLCKRLLDNRTTSMREGWVLSLRLLPCLFRVSRLPTLTPTLARPNHLPSVALPTPSQDSVLKDLWEDEPS